MSSWPGDIAAITLFTEDLAASREFYQRVFGLPVHYEDDVSAVFEFGGTLINLLNVSEADGLIGPAPVASPDAGARFQFTLGVDDVDATCADLRDEGWSCSTAPSTGPGGSARRASATRAATSGRSPSSRLVGQPSAGAPPNPIRLPSGSMYVVLRTPLS